MSSSCSEVKEEILATAVEMSSGVEVPHWSIKTVAKNGEIGIQGRNFLGAALERTVKFLTWAGSVILRREVQTGTANSTREKRGFLEAWAGKAVDLVPTNMIFFSSGMVLLPPSLVTWWKKMMWLAFGVLPMKTVSCLLRLLDRQVSRSTVGAKSAMSGSIVLLLYSFVGLSLKWFSQLFPKNIGMLRDWSGVRLSSWDFLWDFRKLERRLQIGF